MQDLILKDLVNEVNICNAIFNLADDATISIAIYELRAAEERLDLYLKEKKNEKNLDKVD